MQKRLPNISIAPARQCYEPICPFLYPFEHHARTAEPLPLLVGLRQEQHEVLITRLVLCEQTQLMVAVFIQRVDHMQVGANDEFDAKLGGRLVGLYQPKKIMVVRYGYGGHTQLGDPRHQGPNTQ